MIKSAAIIKNAPRAEWREVRLAKKKAKKQAQLERKAMKVYFPSPIRAKQAVEAIEPVTMDIEPSLDVDAPATRQEMETKARELGIKFDGRTPDKKLSSLIASAIGG